MFYLQRNSPIIASIADEAVPSTSKNPKKLQQTITSYVPKKMSCSSKRKIDRELLKLFYYDYQPFRVVDDKGFRGFVKALNPSYDLPNRQSISKTQIPALYEQCLTNCKEIINSVGNVSLTTDCWTSMNNDSFMGVTIHFIDDNFKFQSMLLSCSTFNEAHTSNNLSEELRQITTNWKVEKKILLAVSDNAANIKSAILNGRGWKFFGCYAHTLNLIVQDALNLDVVKDVLSKIKTIVSHFKRSTKATTKLISFQTNTGIKTPKKLIQDIVTRWNSTFFMLERFIELEEAVRTTIALLNADLPQLTAEEWTMTKDLKKILEPFEAATRAVSGQQYMTASLVIVITGGLLDVCDKLVNTVSITQDLRPVIDSLKDGLQTRLGNVEYSNTLAMCTFLDPRFKTYPFKNNDAVERVRKNVVTALGEVILALDNEKKMKHQEQADVVQVSDGDKSELQNEEVESELSLWSSIDSIVRSESSKTATRTINSRAIIEIQRYLEDDIVSRKNDPLKWWSDNKHIYPYLSTLVKQKCCAVATSVPCESLFSKAGNILNDRRSRLNSNKVKQLVFLNYNGKFCET